MESRVEFPELNFDFPDLYCDTELQELSLIKTRILATMDQLKVTKTLTFCSKMVAFSIRSGCCQLAEFNN